MVLAVALIAIAMMSVSCKSSHKDVDMQYKNLYDANTGLDLTGVGIYTVKQSDTLSDISMYAYNDPKKPLAEYSAIHNNLKALW
jgi:nucleoid-associated protein YgaU